MEILQFIISERWGYYTVATMLVDVATSYKQHFFDREEAKKQAKKMFSLLFISAHPHQGVLSEEQTDRI